MSRVLSGVRVVEIASWTYVPSAGAALADWGADVIKVESVEFGDPSRALVVGGFTREAARVDADFMLELGNRGKRSIAIDLKSELGREFFGRLLATADVLLTNWLPGALERARLTVEDIRAFNPNIIIARGSGLGVRGPDRNQGGFDGATYSARGGVAYTLTPFGSDYPAVQGPAFGDLQGGATLAGGVCAALFHRERTGEATIVDSSLLAQAMWAIAPSILVADFFDADGIPGAPPGVAMNPVVNRYKTQDGRWIQLVFLQPDKFWAGFCHRIGLPELATDERFVPSANLVAHTSEAVAILNKAFAEHDLAHWQKVLADEPGVWATYATPRETLNDPQAGPNGYLIANVDDQGKEYRTVAAPVQFGETPPEPSRAPEHGQHTEEILLELGIDWDDIAKGKDVGAVL
ncbi:Crotonobetainyl-CoA:carnitine CoA-transferase CaiB and related acyl-CoA transferases [Mycobacterium numidiamassiliense]|uniref:Crotonobetainyl-CoA:carnitine CoA-transferase CaiB and related acyl-CoA transferases n=1 Tax=Mycobacterium numidiamassiliense TaxID=1841861 RepID=A0A2U3PCE6_9MYCO|nr:CaiB/BaiF CoA-transferase family protein [Mycobacterium numidiamassiliense]SPM41419.1 Crotonobetainyl-CoA:carnitine CoA-transferase CaiB and related acyl-CoA transferases [Mycobacterium numidiamassiliense]